MTVTWWMGFVVCILVGAGLTFNVRAESMMTITENQRERFVVYYGEAEKPETFLPYDVIVFDADKHPPLRELQNRGKSILGYVSVFEAVAYRSHYEDLKKAGLLIRPDGDKGREYIDIRKREWAELLIDVIVPELVKQGFNGIMLDTLDDAVALEERQPASYAGMGQAAVQTIGAIRMHFPYLKIMLNRAFTLLPRVQMKVDMVLAESTLADARAQHAKPVLFDEGARGHVLTMLKTAKQSVPELKIYTLDYWDMADKVGITKLYEMQRLEGFVPYVTTQDLQLVHPEPDVSKHAQVTP